ncbi:hypothetical protein SAMN05216570_2979 [Dyella sp. OK004]|uniref:hypothetical protein n=1 Tax=Dyella sp. OK004 TaxID=1855292 RepID=UPI0008E23633|nr:hypothetical protein [Dyella sp. OK004]SFS13947.1 hypothetical protein SAMN05216570_2979 [Dyella sp. OK004]
MRAFSPISVLFLIFAIVCAVLIGLDKTPILKPTLEWLCAVNVVMFVIALWNRRRL